MTSPATLSTNGISGPVTRSDCSALDAIDPLRAKRDEFILPLDVIYLDGNSLGAMPARVPARMERAISTEWAHGLIRSWNDADWYKAPQRSGAKIAPLIGADPDEVIVCDSTSVNLFKVLVAALRLRPNRSVVLTVDDDFPTDGYISTSVAELMNASTMAVPSADIEDAIIEAGDSLALVHLTHVNYKTGLLYDMNQITEAAHKVGALVVWDLAHSAGALPVDLDGTGADFAIGCGYKYLNGGPGAPAFVFASEEHLPTFRQPLTGWHGHVAPFDFSSVYAPHPGIDRMLGGTAPQLSLIALEEALAVFDGVDMQEIREKSVGLTDLFIALMNQELGSFGFELLSPADSARRGSQISYAHPEGYPIVQALIARGVIGDFRAPNVLRFGVTPLYLRYVDVWDAVATLKAIMDSKSWDAPEFHARKSVT